MSYNLKNKAVFLIAFAFAAITATSHISYAEEADINPEAQAVGDEMLDLDVNTEDNASDQDTSIEETADETENTDVDENSEEAPIVQPDGENADDDFLNATSEDVPDSADQLLNENNELDASSTDPAQQDPSMADSSEGLFDEPLEQPQESDALPDTEAPKSPFESFGNAILSKVDNDLFNQMSSIEKQNTLLNLELKREELKNKVEALRNARVRAKEEEESRRRAEEEKLKDQEAERQAMIIAEQTKLKAKEIELEKVRQAKVLNEYMNEMLQMNQEWVLKNTELQNQIQQLKTERVELIKAFEDQISQIQHDVIILHKKAENTVATHNRIVASLNSQIGSLKKTIAENEDRIKRMQESNTVNPFATAAAAAASMNADMNDGAVDMSQEYAIMDITGHGDDIVAKIVNKEGTTFIVHKGSMLKGGEIVTAITDHYVAFDNNGVKSFIYTGGTVLEFEPTVAFNNSDKLPEETEKVSIKAETKNVLGSATTNDIAPKTPAANTSNSRGTNKSGARRRAGASTSFGTGMFVQ